MSGAHSLLGPSAAHRWMNCSGSPALIASLPDHERSRESIYSRQGSAAHALAEACLRKGIPAVDFLEWGVTDSTGAWELVRMGDREFEEGEGFIVDEEMADAVQIYLDEIARLRALLPLGEEHIEQRVQPLPDRPEVFGTLDYAIFDPLESVLHVIDYKHGSGVFVDAESNPQTRSYALGMLHKIGAESVARVEIAIAQPRARAAELIRREVLTPSALVEWGGTLRAAVDATKAEGAPLHAGPWCGFCPAAAICPKLRQRNLEEAYSDFDAVPSETTLVAPADLFARQSEALARALEWIPVYDAWAREVQGFAQRHVEHGGVIPGWKLVAKRGRRQWINTEKLEEDIRARAKRGDVKATDFYEKKLRSPAQIEKIKAVGKEWVAERCEKVPGGPTLARESDSRPAIAPPALTDFAGVLDANVDVDSLMSSEPSVDEMLA